MTKNNTISPKRFETKDSKCQCQQNEPANFAIHLLKSDKNMCAKKEERENLKKTNRDKPKKKSGGSEEKKMMKIYEWNANFGGIKRFWLKTSLLILSTFEF